MQKPTAAKAKTATAAAIPIPAFAPADRPLESGTLGDVFVVSDSLEERTDDICVADGCAEFEEAGVDVLAVVKIEADTDREVLEEDGVADALADIDLVLDLNVLEEEVEDVLPPARGVN